MVSVWMELADRAPKSCVLRVVLFNILIKDIK